MFFIAFLAQLLFAPAEGQSPPKLPSAAKLVDEAVQVMRDADIKDDLFTSPSLMAALFDVGREADARRMAFESDGEIFRSVMIPSYLQKMTERKGVPPDIDALLANESEQTLTVLYPALVNTLAELNRPAEAEAFFVRETSNEIGTRLNRATAAMSLIDAYRRAGDRDSAKRIACSGLEAASGIVVSFITSERCDPLATAAIDLDEIAALQAFLDAGYAAVEKATERSALSVRMLASGVRAATEDLEGSKQSFEFAGRVARRLVEDISNEQDASKKQMKRADARDALIVLAANERLAGFRQQADARLDEFFRLAMQGEAGSDNEDFKLSKSVETCLKVGDRYDAERLLAKVESPYWRVHVRLEVAEILLDGGDSGAARKLLVEATDEFEQTGDRIHTPDTQGESNRISLLTDMAGIHGRLGDTAAKLDLYRRASELAGKETGHLQQFALSQIRDGLLTEAYATIQQMPSADDRYRVWPLVTLAAAVAKREADRKAK